VPTFLVECNSVFCFANKQSGYASSFICRGRPYTFCTIFALPLPSSEDIARYYPRVAQHQVYFLSYNKQAEANAPFVIVGG
jgi:hypothetical protein